jgi:uncharacterized Zn finger protein (UPF0148 family)
MSEQLAPVATMTASLCTACEGPLFVLAGEERRVCASCDEQARKMVRRVLLNRERQRRWYRRHAKPNARKGKSVRSDVSISRPTRIVHGMAPLDHLRDRTDPPERDVPAVTVIEAGYCACGRSLNLGRHKTGGDTCGQCKKEQTRARRSQPPMYSTFEEVARQLEDPTPLPDDPYSEGAADGSDE